MAEAILRDMAGDRFKVVSAGAFPSPVHPLVDTVLEEADISSSGLASKSIDLFLGRGVIDHIIVVCDAVEKDCPKLDPFTLDLERWPLPDPAATQGDREVQLQAFRQTRDELTERLRVWLRAQIEKPELA